MLIGNLWAKPDWGMAAGSLEMRQKLQMPEKHAIDGKKSGQLREELSRAVLGIRMPECTGDGAMSYRYL